MGVGGRGECVGRGGIRKNKQTRIICNCFPCCPVRVREKHYWSLLYSAILRSWADSLRSHVILHEWIAFYSAFWISTEVVYLQRWHGWCHKNLPPSRHILCTPYNHAPCHFKTSKRNLCALATYLRIFFMLAYDSNLGPNQVFLLTWTGSCDSVVTWPRRTMAAPLCRFFVCPIPGSHSGKHPVKRERCIQSLYHVLPGFMRMYYYIFCTISEGEGKLVLSLMCSTMLWCEKSLHDGDQHNLLFTMDMDYESRRKLCDMPTSRLYSELVYCRI